MDTRFVELPFTVGANNTLTVDHPDNANLLTPGNWMLFAIDDKGVPSVAKTIKVEIGGQIHGRGDAPFATLSGDASKTASGSFQLRTAPEGNRGAVLFNDPVDLSHDVSFSFDVKLGYCACEDGVTFLLHTNEHGEHAPAQVIERRRAAARDRRYGDGGHDHDAHDHERPRRRHADGATLARPATTNTTAMTIIVASAIPTRQPRDQLALTKAPKQALAEDVWHRIAVFWDASEQSLSYTINGAFAGKLTGE